MRLHPHHSQCFHIRAVDQNFVIMHKSSKYNAFIYEYIKHGLSTAVQIR